MTVLVSPPRPDSVRAAKRPKPLVLVATVAGSWAAGSTLLVAAALGILGWFLTDSGTHGTPRDGIWVGIWGWLLGHGSGLRVQGVDITLIPLGVTLLCAWVCWRLANRTGELLAAHGPDADRLADGARDWTVPAAATLFVAGYVVVATLAAVWATTSQAEPSLARTVLGAGLLAAATGLPGLALGSGRAATWAANTLLVLRAAAGSARMTVGTFLILATITWIATLSADLAAAANLADQLGATGTGSVALALANLALAPNATAYAGSYLLGPGFTVGAGTLVTPAAATLGPLPMFPLLVALPDPGPAPGWAAALIAVPGLLAALATARYRRRHPILGWQTSAASGAAGGVLAAGAVTLVLAASGGSIGPGRLSHIGPLVGSACWHAVVGFGLGGLAAALLMTAWQRREAGYPLRGAIAADSDH